MDNFLLNDVPKQLASNIESKSKQLVLLNKSLEKMEFFKQCPVLESQTLKKLIEEIYASSQVLQTSLNIVLN
jgi:hypothetical protein